MICQQVALALTVWLQSGKAAVLRMQRQLDSTVAAAATTCTP
jgi:hypothetical protein